MMKDDLFDELLQSVREGGAILRGEAPASRAFEFPERDGVPDVAAIRERFGLSQARFAQLMGISVGTLRNWEQGRRDPTGPAKALLRAIKNNPHAVLKALAE